MPGSCGAAPPAGPGGLDDEAHHRVGRVGKAERRARRRHAPPARRVGDERGDLRRRAAPACTSASSMSIAAPASTYGGGVVALMAAGVRVRDDDHRTSERRALRDRRSAGAHHDEVALRHAHRHVVEEGGDRVSRRELRRQGAAAARARRRSRGCRTDGRCCSSGSPRSSSATQPVIARLTRRAPCDPPVTRIERSRSPIGRVVDRAYLRADRVAGVHDAGVGQVTRRLRERGGDHPGATREQPGRPTRDRVLLEEHDRDALRERRSDDRHRDVAADADDDVGAHPAAPAGGPRWSRGSAGWSRGRCPQGCRRRRRSRRGSRGEARRPPRAARPPRRGGRPRPPRRQAERLGARARPPAPGSGDPQFPPQLSTCARFVVPCRRPWAEMLSRMPMPTRVVASEVPP